MKRLLIILGFFIFSCDDLPKKKTLQELKKDNEELREENKETLADRIRKAENYQDSLYSIAKENEEKQKQKKFEIIPKSAVIGKTLNTKYFYFTDSNGNIKGEKIFSNTKDFPTQSSLAIRSKTIIYTEGVSQAWNGWWDEEDRFIRKVSDNVYNAYIFSKNKLGEYKVVKYSQFFNDKPFPEMVYILEPK